MAVFDWFTKLFSASKTVATPRHGQRYAAAKSNRLLADWATTSASANREIETALPRLRARSRQLARDNDYIVRFLALAENHIIGPNGVGFQCLAKELNGTPDNLANQIIENAWFRWAKKGNCDVTGTLSLVDMQRLAIRATATDGECLIRKVKGFKKSPFRFALQFIEADYLDTNLNNNKLPNGGYIRMGVEFDRWGRPVAYHLLKKHPGEINSYTSTLGSERERVPANQIIHLFKPGRPGQSRGVPWAHAAMTRLNMLGGYEEAELIAARIGAAKMGFFKQGEDGLGYEGETDENGELITEVEPGTFSQLPPGVDLVQWDPQHPNGNFGPFSKSILRGIASGLNVGYNTIANDLEGVNFSSMRAGVLEEREQWQALQRWFIESFFENFFADWLEFAMLSGNCGNLPFSKFDKFNAPAFKPRTWGWVDPLKDVQAKISEIRSGMKSVDEVIRESGRDPDDVLQEIKKSRDRYEAAGLGWLFNLIYSSQADLGQINEANTNG